MYSEASPNLGACGQWALRDIEIWGDTKLFISKQSLEQANGNSPISIKRIEL